MPEPTATGPNGEKIVFRGGQWQPMTGGAAPQPAPRQAPINTGVNPADAARREAQGLREEEFRYRQKRDQAVDAQKQQEQSEKQAKMDEAQRDAADQLRNVIEKIELIDRDVTDNSFSPGLGETGLLGSVMGNFAGSPAYSLRQDIGTIDAVQVLQAMTRLKELSPTGSTGFGALSAPELRLLQSSVASLDPNMDQETFRRNLKQAKKVYTEMLARIEGGNSAPAKTKTSPDDDALIRKYLD